MANIEDESTVLNIKLTNHMNGEIIEKQVVNITQAKDLVLELAASETVIKKAKVLLMAYIDNMMGDDDDFAFVDGRHAKRIQMESRVFQFDEVKAILGENFEDKDLVISTLEAITKLDQKATIEIFNEMIERGEVPPDSLKRLKDTADVKTTKPFIRIL
jgi:hypothetical protein